MLSAPLINKSFSADKLLVEWSYMYGKLIIDGKFLASPSMFINRRAFSMLVLSRFIIIEEIKILLSSLSIERSQAQASL